MKEAYCSYEVSKLLKEKGFNESCYTYYDDIDNSINRFDKGLHFNNTSYPWGVPYDVSKAKKYVVAPTHQMAMAWLREVHNIFIEISTSRDLNGQYHYSYTILDKECKYIRRGYTFFDWNYEDAVEVSLKYTLENLI